MCRYINVCNLFWIWLQLAILKSQYFFLILKELKTLSILPGYRMNIEKLRSTSMNLIAKHILKLVSPCLCRIGEGGCIWFTFQELEGERRCLPFYFKWSSRDNID